MRILVPAVAGAAMQFIAVGLMTVLFYLLARKIFFDWLAALSVRREYRLPVCGAPRASFIFDDGCRSGTDKQPSHCSNDTLGAACISPDVSERAQIFG